MVIKRKTTSKFTGHQPDDHYLITACACDDPYHVLNVYIDPPLKKNRSTFIRWRPKPKSKDSFKGVFKAPLHMVITNDQLPEILQVSGLLIVHWNLATSNDFRCVFVCIGNFGTSLC